MMRFRYAALPFAFAVMAVSLAAKAQEVGVALPDLIYLPGEGKLVSDTTLTYDRFGESDYEPSYSYANGEYTEQMYRADKYRRDTGAATESLRFGLIDGVVVGVAETCSDVGERYRDEYSPFLGGYPSYGTFSRGCGNPELSATWRMVKQSEFAEFPLNVDLLVRYAPDLLKGDLARPYAASGGQAGDVSLMASRAFDDMSLSGKIGAVWAGKTKLTGGDETQWTEAFARPYAEFLAQYKPDEAVFLTAGAQIYAPYDLNGTIGGFDYVFYGSYYEAPTRQKIGASYQPEVTAAWLAVPDLLAVSLHYSHAFDTTSKVYVSGALSDVYNSISGDTVALNIRLQLF